MRDRLLTIVGPTAVGKTKVSILLAKRFKGEIISGDSMQVYRGMDIGTAKIKPDEQQGIKHHMIDILEPGEDFSVSEFQKRALKLIKGLNEKHVLPMLVGGTGLYVQSVTHHFDFAEVSHDQEIRRKWNQFLERNGALALHQELVKRDPRYAENIHPHNTRRVIRALEILELTGESMALYQEKWDRPSPFDLIMIGLTMERTVLYERIDQRVDLMIEQGLIEEVNRLLQEGVPKQSTAMQAIGYKEIIPYIQGRQTQKEAIETLKRNTRRFAKRQLTWFNRRREIKWIDVTHIRDEIELAEIISDYVAGKFQ